MKTIREWSETIEDYDVRIRAINNTDIDALDLERESLSEAMYFAFIWSYSPEGHSYWIKFVDSLNN